MFDALDYLEAGLSLVPIRADGSKSPAVPWKCYQAYPPTAGEVELWLITRGLGIGIIGGHVSGNLEILDFDASELFAPWADLVEALAPGLVQRHRGDYTAAGKALYAQGYRGERSTTPNHEARQTVSGMSDESVARAVLARVHMAEPLEVR